MKFGIVIRGAIVPEGILSSGSCESGEAAAYVPIVIPHQGATARQSELSG